MGVDDIKAITLAIVAHSNLVLWICRLRGLTTPQQEKSAQRRPSAISPWTARPPSQFLSELLPSPSTLVLMALHPSIAVMTSAWNRKGAFGFAGVSFCSQACSAVQLSSHIIPAKLTILL